MAFDAALAQRLRDALRGKPGVDERKMFGGLAYLRHGHMFIGINGPTVMARIGPARYAQALTMKHVREMDFTGRPMKGYVFVDPEGTRSPDQLQYWIDACIEFVSTLPPKTST